VRREPPDFRQVDCFRSNNSNSFGSAKRPLSDPDLVLVRPSGYLRPRRAAPLISLPGSPDAIRGRQRSGWTIPASHSPRLYRPRHGCQSAKSQSTVAGCSRETSVDKQKKTAIELEEIVKQRIGAGDFRVAVHRNPEIGWHATIYGHEPAEVHRCQVMADTIAAELCQYYELIE
jgi:hypothetical protein